MSAFNTNPLISRRSFFTLAASGTAAITLAGCTSVPSGNGTSFPTLPTIRPLAPAPSLAEARNMYAAIEDEGIKIPAVPVERIDARYYRQEVNDPTGERPGTIVIDTSTHFLYLVTGGGRALRYGVGLGRDGFAWAGRADIERKTKWPRWFPPAEMIDRQPNLEKYRSFYIPATKSWGGGMDPGISNPLGARALYLHENGVDTLYRIHGSPEWWTVGKSVSSGCVRMINQDVIDLYERVPEKAPVFVTSGLRSV